MPIGDDEALRRSALDFSLPTVIYFHAFFEDSMEISPATVKAGQYSIIYYKKILAKLFTLNNLGGDPKRFVNDKIRRSVKLCRPTSELYSLFFDNVTGKIHLH